MHWQKTCKILVMWEVGHHNNHTYTKYKQIAKKAIATLVKITIKKSFVGSFWIFFRSWRNTDKVRNNKRVTFAHDFVKEIFFVTKVSELHVFPLIYISQPLVTSNLNYRAKVADAGNRKVRLLFVLSLLSGTAEDEAAADYCKKAFKAAFMLSKNWRDLPLFCMYL